MAVKTKKKKTGKSQAAPQQKGKDKRPLRHWELLAGQYQSLVKPMRALGDHYEASTRRTYKQGEIVPSRDDLAKEWGREKFRLVHSLPEDYVEQDDEAILINNEVAEMPELDQKPDTSAVQLPSGYANATSEFEMAADLDLIVMERGNHYVVVSSEDTSKPLNGAPLTHDQVGDFLSDYATGGDEDGDEEDDE